jgi:hypothetical protein
VWKFHERHEHDSCHPDDGCAGDDNEHHHRDCDRQYDDVEPRR